MLTYFKKTLLEREEAGRNSKINIHFYSSEKVVSDRIREGAAHSQKSAVFRGRLST